MGQHGTSAHGEKMVISAHEMALTVKILATQPDWPEFSLLGSHSGRRQLTLESCPLFSTYVP